MRSFSLALGLLLTLRASANAATVHHTARAKRRSGGNSAFEKESTVFLTTMTISAS